MRSPLPKRVTVDDFRRSGTDGGEIGACHERGERVQVQGVDRMSGRSRATAAAKGPEPQPASTTRAGSRSLAQSTVGRTIEGVCRTHRPRAAAVRSRRSSYPRGSAPRRMESRARATPTPVKASGSPVEGGVGLRHGAPGQSQAPQNRPKSTGAQDRPRQPPWGNVLTGRVTVSERLSEHETEALSSQSASSRYGSSAVSVISVVAPGGRTNCWLRTLADERVSGAQGFQKILHCSAAASPPL